MEAPGGVGAEDRLAGSSSGFRNEVVRLQPPVQHADLKPGKGLPEVVVGLIASPGPATDLVESLLPELAGRMAARLPDVHWVVRFVTDSLVETPTDLGELIAAARRRMLTDGWHLAVCVTDLPMQTARRPVVAHASATHGVAVLSMPALGAVAVRRRAAEAIVRLVAALLGDVGEAMVDEKGAVDRAGPPSGVTRRVRELGSRVELDETGIQLVARVVAGNLRLLLGMLRANRPWRLSIRLSRASVAALGAGVFALVTSDIWRLSDSLGPLRLSLITVVSIVGNTLTLVLGADLWERSPMSAAREQVVLFNIVTVTTVVIGVLSLYLALFVLTTLGSLVLVPTGLLADALGHPVDVHDQMELVWLASSMATIGDALGAGLESDEAVREAAYTYHPDEELSAES